MSRSNLKVGVLAVAPAVLLALAACGEEPTEPTEPLRPASPNGVNFATALAPGEALARFTPPQDDNGVYLLDRVCDVFIGDPVAAEGEVPQRYTHQAVADIPAGAKVRLVGSEGMGSSKLFTCDATDPDNPTQPVIDPVTLHAAKGDGPKIYAAGVELDLNGYSITVSPSPFLDPTVDPAFENLGIVVEGDGVTLTNSATPGAEIDPETGRPVGVSYIFGFGHNVDVEAEVSPTVRGRRFDGDGDPLTVDWVYNLETRGGMGVRLSGSALVEEVKSVNLDPVAGQGFEIRGCADGSLSVIRNSHFEGGAEGAFIRECRGVTFEHNYVSGHGGQGIVTREAVSTTARPIVIRNNTVADNAYGIVWGRDSRSNNGSLVISGNTISAYSACGIAISRRNTTFGPYTLATLAAANTFDRTTNRTCRLDD